MKELLISIIVPAYNTSDVIHRTLKSIENQTYKQYELIIINDGSTDDTTAILNEYKRGKSNVHVYYQENQGVSAARNKGIDLATGDFICFIDSDDTFEPDFLELMIKRQIETNGNSIYCGYNRVDSDQKIVSGDTKYYNGNILQYFFQKTNFLPYLFHLNSMLIRKSLLIENNIYFELGRKISEDVFFILKIIAISDFYSVNKNLYNYIYRYNSVCNQPSLNHTIDEINGWLNMLLFVENLDKEKNETTKSLKYINLFILNLQLSKMKELLKSFNYKKLNEMLKMIQFEEQNKKMNKNDFTPSQLKIINCCLTQNKFKWILFSLYYNIRINFKFLKKR